MWWSYNHQNAICDPAMGNADYGRDPQGEVKS